MANGYSQTFTLEDIFSNKKLRGKIPLIRLKETEKENGKISVRTSGKTVNRQVFDTADSAARPFYSPYHSTRSGNTMVIDGALKGNHDDAVEAVYEALANIRSVLIWTANNADMIRTAIKEAAKSRRQTGQTPRLYLRAKSMQEIEAMTNPQIRQLMSDIMDNIVYGDGFPETQQKWGADRLPVNNALTYEQRREKWQRMVGAL